MTDKEILKTKYRKILYTKAILGLGDLSDEQCQTISGVIRDAIEIGLDFNELILKERKDAEIEGRGFGSLI